MRDLYNSYSVFFKNISVQLALHQSLLFSISGSLRRLFRYSFAVLLALPLTCAWAGSINYSYDSLGRLTKAVYVDGTTVTTLNYGYDDAGNWTAVTTTTP
jgi:YD repeat-containing protein